nr:hypothetical protein [Tanacetum cinerariifolium]
MNPNNNQGLPPTDPIPQNLALDLRTMEELCQPTMNGRGRPIAPINIQQISEMNENFLRMSQSNQQVNVVNRVMRLVVVHIIIPSVKVPVTSLKGTNGKKAFNERPQSVLPSNTVPNPREEVKVIITRSGITLAGPSVPPPNHPSSSKEVERDTEPIMDQESTIPLNEINSQIPPSILITTFPHVLPIKDPEDSLIMGNEELNTILEKESDEFIKSSVEDLVLIPSESEDTSRSDSDSNDYFISSDDESLSDEDVPKDNVKIYSNPLFEFDDEYISSDVNPLFDVVLKNIECKDSYDSNLNEPDLLVTHISDINVDDCFDLRGDVDMINDFEDGYYDSEGDILYLESLLNDDVVHRDSSILATSVASILEGFTDEPPFKENDDLLDLESKNDEWKKILYDAQIDDLMSEDKIFDPRIHDQIFSPTYVSLPFTDHHYLFFTYVVRIFLPHITYLVVSPFFSPLGVRIIFLTPASLLFLFLIGVELSYASMIPYHHEEHRACFQSSNTRSPINYMIISREIFYPDLNCGFLLPSAK